jgi:hypothetical protein
VLLGHLVAMAATQTDAGATLAQSFLLAAWARDDEGTDANDKRIGTLTAHRLRLEQAHRDHAMHALTLDALPHGMAVGVCGWLHEQREKSRQYGDILLRRLLQGLDDPASHVREKVIKALGGVLDCDVSLLGNAHVEAAVQVSVRVRAYSVVVVPWFRRLTSLPWLSGEEATHTTGSLCETRDLEGFQFRASGVRGFRVHRSANRERRGLEDGASRLPEPYFLGLAPKLDA